MQTLPIKIPDAEQTAERKQRWVTSFFGITDDFKKAVPKQEASSLLIRGVPLGQVASCLGIQLSDLWPSNEQGCSIWNAR